jgi:hypothetical protein
LLLDFLRRKPSASVSISTWTGVTSGKASTFSLRSARMPQRRSASTPRRRAIVHDRRRL